MPYSDNRLWNLFARKLSGEATQEELSELEIYLEESSDAKNIVNNIEVYWNEKIDLLTINDEMEEERFHLILNAEDDEDKDEDKIEEEVHGTIETKAIKSKIITFFLAVAASLLLIYIASVFVKNQQPFPSILAKSAIQKVFVKPGSKSKIILPDGTVVRLNGSSKLTYKNDFNKNVREVDLDGEAFFEVTKDAHHPFIVHTSNIDIKVLGTIFNVKSYEQDPTIETTLLRGSIEVFSKNDASAPKVILKPNEKMVFRKREEKIPENNNKTAASSNNISPDENISISSLSPAKPDSLKEETSWLYNKLVIDNDDFIKMAEKMERWYGVRIKILSPELEKYHFKGIFENETIQQALNALQLTVKFHYNINNDLVTISQ